MIRHRTLLQWSDVFGITVEDLDGFPNLKNGGVYTTNLSLETFLQGISFCTIRWDNVERYKVLDALLN